MYDNRQPSELNDSVLRDEMRAVNEQLIISSVRLQEDAERDRTITQTLQRYMMYMPPENSFPGLVVNRSYEAADDDASVGGDFSDTFACDHGNVALVLGDVTGHGLYAAMLTAELKYVIRGYVREHAQPGRIMTQINSYLCEGFRLHKEGLNNEGNDSPLCLYILIIHSASGNASVACAGMESPLLIRQDGQMEELSCGGLLLGVGLSETYSQTDFQLELGDSVVLTTDGVTESRQGRSFLGYDGMKRLAHQGWANGTLASIGNTVVEGAREFGGGILRDDVCVLLARRQ
jgi:serine phosphatase RsbU (regulator of sigma subunit)